MPDRPDLLSPTSLADCLQQAAPHDLVLTASNRLARDLKQRFAFAGRHLLPRVLPYGAWLAECWRQLRLEDALSGQTNGPHVLLTEAQEELLWDRTLRDAGAGERLLFLGETVRACLRSYQLLLGFRLPRNHPSFARSEESRLFLEWASAVEARCAAAGWLPRAALPGWLAERLSGLPGLAQQRIFLAGFEEITPVQKELFAALRQFSAGVWAVDETPFAPAPQCSVYAANSALDEWQEAARWAAQQLRDRPDGRFAVVVPELTTHFKRVERVFQQVFHTGTETASLLPAGTSPAGSVHLSFAPPLLSQPLVQAALCLLRVLAAPPSLKDLRFLLRSPYLDGGLDEAHDRSFLEAFLLEQRRDRLPLARVRTLAGQLPAQLGRLQGLLAHLEDAAARITETPERAPSAWSAYVRTLWGKTLWLDASLTSDEFQVRQRLLEELGAMALLDEVEPQCDWPRFVRLLRGCLEQTGFQPDRPGGQILVAGMFEVTGLRFDAVWLSGLTDKVLPRPVAPDPFLPLELQQTFQLPRASAAHEQIFAARLFDRLYRLAPELVLSYAQWEGDEPQQCSPFLRALPGTLPDSALSSPGVPDPPVPARSELLEDWNAGTFMPDRSVLAGGTALLKNQSDCPFRAFVAARLASDTLEWQAPLMDRLDQGTLVHAALEEFWRRTRNREALTNMDDEERARRISACAEAALAKFRLDPDDLLALAQCDAEFLRLCQLLEAWLQEEQAREPFVVLETEARRSLPVGGATLRMRADRIDQLSDGSLALIDYKTGDANSATWLGARPEEPQLLAYLAAEDRPVGALAFASLKAGNLGWRFYGTDGGARFQVREGRKKTDPPGGWEEFLDGARQAVAALADAFARGEAAIDPRNPAKTCPHCIQKPLCRFAEWRSDLAAEEGGGETAGEAEEEE